MSEEAIAAVIIALLPAVASAISAMKSDSSGGKLLQFLMRVVNIVALNVGKAKNKGN